MWYGDLARATTLLDEAIVLAREVDDATAIALATLGHGRVAAEQGDLDRAEAMAADALTRLRLLLESSARTGQALFLLCYVAILRGDHKRAVQFFA